MGIFAVQKPRVNKKQYFFFSYAYDYNIENSIFGLLSFWTPPLTVAPWLASLLMLQTWTSRSPFYSTGEREGALFSSFTTGLSRSPLISNLKSSSIHHDFKERTPLFSLRSVISLLVGRRSQQALLPCLKKTPSETQMLCLKKQTKKNQEEGENAALADPDLIQSLNFFEPISRVCVYFEPAPCRGCAGAKRAGVSAAAQKLSCSVWHFGLLDAERSWVWTRCSRQERLFRSPHLQQVSFSGNSIQKRTSRCLTSVTNPFKSKSLYVQFANFYNWAVKVHLRLS